MLNSEIIQETRGIVQEMTESNAHVKNVTLLAWIDACSLQLFSSTGSLPKGSVAGVVAAATVTLPASLLRLDYASIVDSAGKHRKIETIDFNNFIRIRPNWEDCPANKPEFMVRMTDSDWMMWPTPDAENTGKDLTLYGTLNPISGATLTGSPETSVVLHPCYPHYLAWKYFLVINNPERAGAEFGAYDSLRKMNIGTATSTTGSLLQFKIRGM